MRIEALEVVMLALGAMYAVHLRWLGETKQKERVRVADERREFMARMPFN